jgi:imidazolonepropionase-like amidohydrolase
MSRVIFTNANLLDGRHGPRPGSTVVVDAERIANVEYGRSSTDLQLAGADRVIDLAGRTLMPGMITCHFHSTYHELGAAPPPLGLEKPPAYMALRAAKNLETALLCGFTGAVSAGAAHDIDAAMKLAIDDGLIPGPRFMPGSRDLSTTGHANDSTPWYWDLHAAPAIRLCDGPDEFRRGVREEIKRGAEIIKLFVTGGHGTRAPKDAPEMTRAELQAAAEAAHDRGRRIRGHIANKRAILMAIDVGLDVIDHADDMDRECIERLAAAGTFVAPSLYFPRALMERSGPMLGFTAAMRADYERMCAILPEAHAAGVRLVIGDDYGAAGLPHGRYAGELELYVREAGIAPLDVLHWATVNGAALLGMSDQLGTIEPGKLADLLVVDGDPLADIAVLQNRDRLLAIIKGGAFVKDALPRTADERGQAR